MNRTEGSQFHGKSLNALHGTIPVPAQNFFLALPQALYTLFYVIRPTPEVGKVFASTLSYVYNY